jgi:kynureninase
MSAVRAKSLVLTGLLEHLILTQVPQGEVSIFTPSDPEQRGCQLSLSFRQDLDIVFSKLQAAGVVCDVRKPNVMRVAPAPLYNSAQDVFEFVQLLKESLAGN